MGGEARQSRDSCAEGRGGGERGNPGSSRGCGSVRAGFLLPQDRGIISLVSLVVGDRNLDSEPSRRELAWRSLVYSPFRSFIGGKREKKMPLHLILSPGTAEGLS